MVCRDRPVPFPRVPSEFFRSELQGRTRRCPRPLRLRFGPQVSWMSASEAGGFPYLPCIRLQGCRAHRILRDGPAYVPKQRLRLACHIVRYWADWPFPISILGRSPATGLPLTSNLESLASQAAQGCTKVILWLDFCFVLP